MSDWHWLVESGKLQALLALYRKCKATTEPLRVLSRTTLNA